MLAASTLRTAAVLSAVIAVYALGNPAAVDARVTFESPYTLAQTYNCALRLVRVDLGLEITEKDPTVAYVLFGYKSRESGERVVPGSIQMLDAGRTVKVLVQLGAMPRYHEQVMIDALSRKLRDEFGEPAPRPTHHDPVDAGPDSGSAAE